MANYFEWNQPSRLQPNLALCVGDRGWMVVSGRREGPGANSCPNILHADLYSLHPCCYWYHYAGCTCCEEGAGTGNGEVMELQALTRSDTGSRSAKHPPDFNGSGTFPVSALDQRSLPANQNTWTYGASLLPLCSLLFAEMGREDKGGGCSGHWTGRTSVAPWDWRPPPCDFLDSLRRLSCFSSLGQPNFVLKCLF